MKLLNLTLTSVQCSHLNLIFFRFGSSVADFLDLKPEGTSSNLRIRSLALPSTAIRLRKRRKQRQYSGPFEECVKRRSSFGSLIPYSQYPIQGVLEGQGTETDEIWDLPNR
ncbi:unnamed protein product [Callosobruchus maculatus]|uniref:Uncharacterized protein n=1 Tax=Callosobruchus maculatus TaxID=64391 RepID=A0A653BRD5_CALMS|nr:unnamed protein product [Callosobruchus maculatus]